MSLGKCRKRASYHRRGFGAIAGADMPSTEHPVNQTRSDHFHVLPLLPMYNRPYCNAITRITRCSWAHLARGPSRGLSVSRGSGPPRPRLVTRDRVILQLQPAMATTFETKLTKGTRQTLHTLAPKKMHGLSTICQSAVTNGAPISVVARLLKVTAPSLASRAHG